VYGHLQVLSTIFCEDISIFVWSGEERDLTLQYMGGIGLMSGVLGALPGLGLLLSVRGALHMGGAVFRSGDGGYALFHGFFSCVVIIRLSSGWLPMMLTAVVHVTHLKLVSFVCTFSFI